MVRDGTRYRRAGNRLRINAQLVDATTAFPVWSERYDREMEDLFGTLSLSSSSRLNTGESSLVVGRESQETLAIGRVSVCSGSCFWPPSGSRLGSTPGIPRGTPFG